MNKRILLLYCFFLLSMVVFIIAFEENLFITADICTPTSGGQACSVVDAASLTSAPDNIPSNATCKWASALCSWNYTIGDSAKTDTFDFANITIYNWFFSDWTQSGGPDQITLQYCVDDRCFDLESFVNPGTGVANNTYATPQITNFTDADATIIRFFGDGQTQGGDTMTISVDAAEINITTVVGANVPPTVSNVLLNATSNANLTTDNLTVFFDVSDSETDTIVNITDWRKEEQSIAFLNMPFDLNVSNNTGAVKDYSTFGSNGTLINQTLWNSDNCAIGGCYIFDGDADYINLGNDTAFGDVQIGFTIVGWFNEDGTKSLPTVFGQYLSVASGELIKLVRLDSDTLNYFTSSIDNFQSVAMSTTYPVNQWTFFAVRVNGTLAAASVLLQLNETVEHFDFGLGMNETPNTNIGIRIGGAENMNPDEHYSGLIDEINFFNRTLSQEQILEIYTNGRKNISMNILLKNETFLGDNWTVAVTATDLMNQSLTVISNNVEIIDGVADTCTYTSGDFNVICNDNCTITSNIVIDSGFRVNITGAGKFQVDGVSLTGYTTFETLGISTTEICIAESINGGVIKP